VAYSVKPVTPSRWKDMERLFEGRGGPKYCWCTPYRFADSPERTKAPERKEAMRGRVAAGGPVGVLLYDGAEPVGWCSVAPRESYERLDASWTMPRVDGRRTWTVLCFFVRSDHRGQGATRVLLDGAVAYARKKGAEVVEGYPFDSSGTTSRHRGHSTMFAGAGFARDGPTDRRWSLELR
jgi:GNAT superfamily N-acetyltransferase